MSTGESGKSREDAFRAGDIYMYQGNVPPFTAHTHMAEKAVLDKGEWQFFCKCGTEVDAAQAKDDFAEQEKIYTNRAAAFSFARAAAKNSDA